MGVIVRRYRWHLVTGIVAVGSAVLVTVAVLAIGDIRWSRAWPWIVLLLGLFLGLLALVIQSYAPPGPNFVERALAIKIEPILIILGASLTLVGIIFWFDLDQSDDRPSLWWAAVVGIGLLILLVGVLRIISPSGPENLADPTLAMVQAYGKRTRQIIEEAQKVERRANEHSPPLGADPLSTITTLSAKLRALGGPLDAQDDRVAELDRELRRLRSEAQGRLLDAETELEMLTTRLDRAASHAWRTRATCAPVPDEEGGS